MLFILILVSLVKSMLTIIILYNFLLQFIYNFFYLLKLLASV